MKLTDRFKVFPRFAAVCSVLVGCLVLVEDGAKLLRVPVLVEMTVVALATGLVFSIFWWWVSAQLHQMELHQQRERQRSLELSAIVDASEDAIIGETLEGIITSWNKGAERLYGYTASEVIGQSIRVIIPPDRIDELPALLGRLQHGERVEPFETVRRRKDGTRVATSLTISPLKDASGVIIGAASIAQDIAERKWAENRNRQFSSVIDCIGDIVVITDCNGLIEYVNPAFSAVTGYALEELKGKTPRILKSGVQGPEFYARLWCTIRNGQPFRAVFVNKKKSGELYYEEETIMPIRDSQGVITHFISTGRDVTERLRLAQEANRKNRLLEEANQQLQRLATLKDEFVATVSHELRTPLTAIKEGISLLLDEALGAINAEQCDFMQTVDESIDRLATLINNMLDLSKIEAGRLQLSRVRVSLPSLIETAVKQYKTLIGPRTLRIELAKVPEIFADSDRVLQILGNLLSNAAKFTPPIGAITVSAERREECVAISVQDSGSGISPADLSQLFQKFSQVGAQKGRPGGTGLGLALCKQLVDLHGGTITATSELGHGTTVTFTIPVYTPQLSLKEQFNKVVELSRRRGEGKVGVMVLDVQPALEGDTLSSSQRLHEIVELVRGHIHHGDVVLAMEPHWVILLALNDPHGVEAMTGRLHSAISEYAAAKGWPLPDVPLRFGAAYYPVDGADIQQLIAKATASGEVTERTRRSTASEKPLAVTG